MRVAEAPSNLRNASSRVRCAQGSSRVTALSLWLRRYWSMTLRGSTATPSPFDTMRHMQSKLLIRIRSFSALPSRSASLVSKVCTELSRCGPTISCSSTSSKRTR
ncbi:hypothetical protein D3C85_1567870 [compost metagenome]